MLPSAVHPVRLLLSLFAVSVSLLVSGCGSGSGTSPVSPPTYTVNVTVSGLNGTGLVLQINGGDDLSVSTTGMKTFSTGLVNGAAYAVSVLTQPSAPAQRCVVTNGSGTVANANVTNIAIACSDVARFAYVANQGDDSVWSYTIDPETGMLTYTGKVTVSSAPSAITVDPAGKFVYVMPRYGSYIDIFKIDNQSGVLSFVSSVNFAATQAPLVIDSNGRFAYAVSSATQSLATFSIDSVTGNLTQIETHNTGQVTGFQLHPSGNFAYIIRSGSDRMFKYTVNSTTGMLTWVGGAARLDLLPSGFAINPTGTLMAVVSVDILSSFGLANGLRIDPLNGTLSSTSNPDASAYRAVVFTPSGKFAYMGGFGVASYSINQITEVISLDRVFSNVNVRDLEIDLSGRFLYIPEENNAQISLYAINPDTGEVTRTGGSSSGPMPVGLVSTK